MKLSTTLPLLMLLAATGAGALDQKFLEPVVPTSTALKAQGGASTANATGYEALFVNPAAYADEKSSLTLLDLESTAHIALSDLTGLVEKRSSWTNTNYTDSANPMTAVINNLLTRNGLGAEVSLGSGWVGKNLGIGLNLQTRTMAKGRSLLGASATLDTTIQGVIGMGWPFDVGLGTLQVGGALRPMQKSYMVAGVSDLMNNTSDLSAYTISSGFGLGIDLGLRWNYAGFKTGLVVRDAGSTVISFKDYGLDEWVAGLGFPSNGSTDGTTLYRIPTVIGLGTSWTPDMGSAATLFQPTLSADLQIPLKDENTQSSFWTWTHIGAEAKFLQFLALRTGVNQGYFTFGMGAKLSIVDFNVAFFSDELGRYSGLGRRPGISMDLAFRL